MFITQSRSVKFYTILVICLLYSHLIYCALQCIIINSRMLNSISSVDRFNDPAQEANIQYWCIHFEGSKKEGIFDEETCWSVREEVRCPTAKGTQQELQRDNEWGEYHSEIKKSQSWTGWKTRTKIIEITRILFLGSSLSAPSSHIYRKSTLSSVCVEGEQGDR